MDSPPNPYKKSAPVSRSNANGLGAMADALLHGPTPPCVSSSMTDSTWNRSVNGEWETVLSSLSVSSASVSRSALGAPVRSPDASVSRTRVSISGLEATEEAMLRSMSRSRSRSSVPVSFPPSYRTGPPTRTVPSAAESQRRIHQVESAVKMASSATPARHTNGLFKAICSTDLLFLIDTTGSMRPYIDAAKNKVRSIIEEIQHAFLGESNMRVAVVAYKDHSDSPNVTFLDFTTSIDQVQAFLGGLSAIGGEDAPEDVLGGIQKAVDATWKQATRCIIHIADQPGHGHTLHNFSKADDHYYTPGSEPHGLTYAPLIQMLVKLHVNYTFLRVLPHYTDRMILEFSRVYESAGAESQLHSANQYYKLASGHRGSKVGGSSRLTNSPGTTNSPQLLFQELLLGTNTGSLSGLVLKSVTASVTRTASRYCSSRRPTPFASSTDGLLTLEEEIFSVVNEEVEPVPLETTPPQWNPPWLDKTLELEGYCPEVVVFGERTLDDMMASDDHIKLSFAQLKVYARSKPFGQGAQRLASYARISASPCRYVVKSFTSGNQRLECFIDDMRMQALSKAFALEFNGLVRPEQAIDFVVTACLQQVHSRVDAALEEKGDCLSLEPYLDGDYVKYNNNTFYVNQDSPDDPINRVAQAFSHFTFERSLGQLMVVDLQGVGNLFTDPVIHTRDPERFKLSDLNLGTEGFKCFFAAHHCNEVCQQLSLVSNRDMAGSGDFQFRQQWPSIEPTVCCSNKLCQSIIRLARAKTSSQFPGYRWCDKCWPELQASTVRLTCAAPGPTHKFDVSRFFYASQGKLTPHKCLEHVDKDMTACTTASTDSSLWSKIMGTSRGGTVLGKVYG